MIWKAFIYVHVDPMVHPEAVFWPCCWLLEAKSAKDPSKEAAKETEKTEKPAATKPAVQAATGW